MMYLKTSDGHRKAAEGEDSGEIRVVICGKTAGGAIVPLLCDDDGKIIMAP